MRPQTAQEFLEQIGPRALTAEETRQLHILRLQEGAEGNSGIAAEIIKEKAK